jgi:hypothetical protein
MTTPEAECWRCGAVGPTITWVGESGVVGFIHGMSEQYCERCVVTLQLDYARDLAVKIPALETRLAELGGPSVEIPRKPRWEP